MKRTLASLLTGTVLLVFAGTAQAKGTLVTAPLFVHNTQVAYCKITNAGKKDDNVTIEIVNPSGTVVNSSTAALVVGSTLALAQAGPFTNLYCRFQVEGARKGFRAVMTVGDNSQDFFSTPAF